MKILIYGLNFAPEIVGCGKYNAEMANWLRKNGHEVRVIAAHPYYPSWKIQKGYSSLKFFREKWWGKVKAIRCPIYIPEFPTGVKRLVHLFSFAISSIPALIANLKWQPDIVFNIAPTIISSPLAIIFSKFCKAVSWLHIQDFELEAASGLNLIKNKKLIFFANLIQNAILNSFTIISSISPEMIKNLSRKGIVKKKTFLLPNWVDLTKIFPLPNPQTIKKDFGYALSKVICLYSGNIGKKQGLEIIIECAKILEKEKEIEFLICGEGSEKPKLIELAKNLGSVKFLPLQPNADFNKLMNLADIHILPQKSDVADLVLPSKLSGILASGKPVIATASPDTQIFNTLRNIGITVKPESSSQMAKAILFLAHRPELRKDLGAKALRYTCENLNKEQILNSFLEKAHILFNQKNVSK